MSDDKQEPTAGDRQDPTVARVKDLEQALLATRHMLAKAQAERDELRTAADLALAEHASLEAARARSDRDFEQRTREVGALAQANTAIGVALLDAQIERDDATAELERTRSDLVRVTEERNAARESFRAQTFELHLLRDEPAEKRLPAVGGERDELQRAVDAALVDHSRLEAARAEAVEESRRLKFLCADLEQKIDCGDSDCGECLACVNAIAVSVSRMAIKDRDALKAQLAAIASECETGAAAAEDKIAKLDAALDAVLPLAEAEAARISGRASGAHRSHEQGAHALERRVESLTEQNKRLTGALGAADAAGRSLAELLRDAASSCATAGGGPLEDCLRLMANEIEAVLAESAQ